MKINPHPLYVERTVLGPAVADDCCIYCDEIIERNEPNTVKIRLFAETVSMYGRAATLQAHYDCYREHAKGYPPIEGAGNPLRRRNPDYWKKEGDRYYYHVEECEYKTYLDAMKHLTRWTQIFEPRVGPTEHILETRPDGTYWVWHGYDPEKHPYHAGFRSAWRLQEYKENPLRRRNPPLVISCRQIDFPANQRDITCEYCHDQMTSGEDCIEVKVMSGRGYPRWGSPASMVITTYIHEPCWERAGRYPPLYQPPKRKLIEQNVRAVKSSTVDRNKLANKFRELAQSMQKDIDYKLHPAIAGQNLTRRRAHIAEGMAQDGERLAKVQKALTSMAADLATNKLSPDLVKITSKKAVETALGRWYPDNAGLTQDEWQKAHMALEKYLTAPVLTAEQIREQELKKLTHELIGWKMPGFFPSPPVVVEKLMALAGILTPGMRILEPSAGKGDIADAIVKACPACKLDLVEMNYTLADILVKKGYSPERMDFLQFRGGPYDRIIMNPPFERGQDVMHVMHAYELLAPGGRLVSVMGVHPFFGSDRPSLYFRDWFKAAGGRVFEPIAMAFTGAKSFRQTGVNYKFVVIEKPRNHV